MATLPAGQPVWLRWTLAAPIMGVALVGPALAFVLISAADDPGRGDRTLMQAADRLYGSVWFVAAFLIPGVIAALALRRQVLAWRKPYLIMTSVVVGPWTVSLTLFDATQHDATEPWIVPLAVGAAGLLGGYLLATGAIRLLAAPSARLAASAMEMVVPMRARPGAPPWRHGWIRMQWDRVRIEAGGKAGTAVMAWWAMHSVQSGEFTHDNALRVTEIGSPLAQPTILLFAGPGVRLDGEPGTLYVSCDDPTRVAEAIAARVAWASRRPWTEGPELDESTARAEYEEARDMLKGYPPTVVTGAPALVALTIMMTLLTSISIYLGIHHGLHNGRPAHTIVVGSLFATLFAGLDVYAVHLLRNYVRGQRFLEANDEPVPDQPATPWLARGEPIVVRPEISEDPDEPFVMHKPVRSARRARRPPGRRRR